MEISLPVFIPGLKMIYSVRLQMQRSLVAGLNRRTKRTGSEIKNINKIMDDKAAHRIYYLIDFTDLSSLLFS